MCLLKHLLSRSHTTAQLRILSSEKSGPNLQSLCVKYAGQQQSLAKCMQGGSQSYCSNARQPVCSQRLPQRPPPLLSYLSPVKRFKERLCGIADGCRFLYAFRLLAPHMI